MTKPTARERAFVSQLTEAIWERFGTGAFIIVTCREVFQNPDRLFVSICRYGEYVDGERGIGMLLPVASINRCLEIISEAFPEPEAQS